MHMLYNSENFAVMHFSGNTAAGQGFEIVDKTSRREIYLGGLLAEHFQAGVEYRLHHAGPPPGRAALSATARISTRLATCAKSAIGAKMSRPCP
jgi:Protein of unknown function (DUF3567)